MNSFFLTCNRSKRSIVVDETTAKLLAPGGVCAANP